MLLGVDSSDIGCYDRGDDGSLLGFDIITDVEFFQAAG